MVDTRPGTYHTVRVSGDPVDPTEEAGDGLDSDEECEPCDDPCFGGSTVVVETWDPAFIALTRILLADLWRLLHQRVQHLLLGPISQPAGRGS